MVALLEGPPVSCTPNGDDNDEDVRLSATGDPVRDEFNNILDLAYRFSKNFGQDIGDERSDAERSFIQSREQDFRRVAGGNQNILHFLAKDAKLVKNGISLRWVATRIMAYYPELMGQTDDQGRTPFSLAVTERNEIFIRAYSRINPPRSHAIQKELKGQFDRSSANPSETYLHLAMKTEISAEARKILLKAAPAEMIYTRNPEGLTPLHLAVDFNRCSTEQVGVIRVLFNELSLNSAMKALTTMTYIPQSSAKNNLSAYQYHEYTRLNENSHGEQTSGAKEIRAMLELQYLRKLFAITAARCLSLPGDMGECLIGAFHQTHKY